MFSGVYMCALWVKCRRKQQQFVMVYNNLHRILNRMSMICIQNSAISDTYVDIADSVDCILV